MSTHGTSAAISTANWASIWGPFDFEDGQISFRGKPLPFKTPQGEEKMGLTFGLAMSDLPFTGGEISATVTFSGSNPMASCELVYYYDPAKKVYLSAGISGNPTMYLIRQWTGSEFHNYAGSGDRTGFRHGRAYTMRVNVRGSRITLFVDDVEVLGTSIPASVSPSQAGIWCANDSDVRVTNYSMAPTRGRVFVVMQFSSPFNEIFQDVLKGVCDEFNLVAYRADETYGSGMIIQDITRGITDSEFVLADITPANANVYYEVGYAHASNKPVILLADRKELPRIPFDLSAFRVVLYDNSIGGKKMFEEALRKNIAAVMEKNVAPASGGQR